MAEEMTPEARRAVRFAHEALGMLVRVKPTKILALDRVSEHTDPSDVK